MLRVKIMKKEILNKLDHAGPYCNSSEVKEVDWWTSSIVDSPADTEDVRILKINVFIMTVMGNFI